MARIKDTTVEAVTPGRRLRRGRRGAHAAAQGRRAPHRPLPVPRGAHAELLASTRSTKLYYCFGCGKGGDMIGFVQETQGLDFVGAIEWLADRFRIPIEYEESARRPRTRDAPRRKRLLALLDEAATLLRALPVGLAGRLASRATTSPAAASARRSAASSGSGSRSAARRSRARRARRASRPRSSGPPGSTRQRGGDYFQRRLVFPLADARGRVLGFQARRLHEDDPLQAKYVNTPESELFTRARSSTGSTRRAPRSRREDRACVVEGNTDVHRAPAGRRSSRSSRAWARRSPSSSCASSAG